jgi:hypothetical protein
MFNMGVPLMLMIIVAVYLRGWDMLPFRLFRRKGNISHILPFQNLSLEHVWGFFFIPGLVSPRRYHRSTYFFVRHKKVPKKAAALAKRAMSLT